MWSLGCILGEMLLGKFKSFQTLLSYTYIISFIPVSWFVNDNVHQHFIFIAGKPLFPGTSTLDQIEKIMTIIPSPSRQGKVRELLWDQCVDIVAGK